MAFHVRRQIRDALVTQLTGLTTTGTNVFPSRLYALETSSLPAIRIYVAQGESEEVETSEILGVGGSREQTRILTVIVEAVAKATSDVDDTLDLICAEVEAAIAGDVTVSGIAFDSVLVSIETELDQEGEQPVGVARMAYAITYGVVESDPTVSLA